MKHSKKILALILSVAVVASIAAAGTLAWLTADTDDVVNTFTVGKIEIDLKEHKLLEDGTLGTEEVLMNEYTHVLPGAELNKDPFVTVKADSEDCYLYVQVLNGLDAMAPGSATVNINVYDEIENPDGKWVAVDAENGIYRYVDVVETATDNQTFTVFDKVYISSELETAEDLAAINNGIIAIKACAIQADNNDEPTATTTAIGFFMEDKA